MLGLSIIRVARKMENGDYSSGISGTRDLEHDGYNTTPHVVRHYLSQQVLLYT
jgi:hypothetical protein